MAPVLYVSEICTLQELDTPGITANGMKFLRKTAQYKWNEHRRNQDITKELKTPQVIKEISNYKNKWIQHVRRMEGSGLPQAIIKHRPLGTRNPGQPQKRLPDGYTEAVTGLEAQLHDSIMMLMSDRTN
jgi:hypothetical protein